MDYKEKYLKYKDKYLKLKSNQKGGVIPNTLINSEVEIRADGVSGEELNGSIETIIKTINNGSRSTNDECEEQIFDFLKEFLQELNRIANEELARITGDITFVCVGNTPYKVLKLFEILKNNPRLKFVYVPYSGKFLKITGVSTEEQNRRCTCGNIKTFLEKIQISPEEYQTWYNTMVAEWADYKGRFRQLSYNYDGNMYKIIHPRVCPLYQTGVDFWDKDKQVEPTDAEPEYYLKNPVEIVGEQYSPEQLAHFRNIIHTSGLMRQINESDKIIFIDYLESARGFLSFLITLDSILTPEQKRKIEIIGVEHYHPPESGVPSNHHTWKQTFTPLTKYSLIISDNLMLNTYSLKYIVLNSLLLGCSYSFFLIDHNPPNRCVRSYSKDRWVGDYTSFYDEIDLTNCNALLIYLYRRLIAEGFVLA